MLPQNSTKATAAETYCKLGLSVLPWSYRSRKAGGTPEKLPSKPWQVGEVPPMALKEVRDWWRKADDNVGVITGPTGLPVGIVVVDLDNDAAIQWAEESLPLTPWVVKSSRGQHWGYRYPKLPPGLHIGNRAHLPVAPGAKVDIRGRGGYVAMPPSVHASGHVYSWLEAPTQLADLPEFDTSWFGGLNLYGSAREAAATAPPKPPAPAEFVQAAQAWIATQPPAIEGAGGDDHTFTIARGLTYGFCLNVEQALPLLQNWNLHCQPPWDDDRLIRNLERAIELPPDRWPGFLHTAPVEALRQACKASRQEKVKDHTQLAHDLPGLCTNDKGAAFTPDAIAAARWLRQNDAPAFIRLRTELGTVKVPLKEWDKAVAVERRAPVEDTTKPPVLPKSEIPKVRIGSDERANSLACLKALTTDSRVFRFGENFVHVVDDDVIHLRGMTMRNALLECMTPVKVSRDQNGVPVTNIVPLPPRIEDMVTNALPEHLRQFRSLRRIVMTPFLSSSNERHYRVVTGEGWDPATGTLLSKAPTGLSVDRFSSPESAIAELRHVYADFPFASEEDWSNLLGAIVQLVARPMIDGPTPLLVLEASQERAGKSLIAQTLLVLAGVDPPAATNWPVKADMVPQTIFATVRSGRQAQIWDNVSGVVDSPDLAALLTAQVFESRILRTSDMQRVPCEQLLWGMTSNNALLSGELAKRTQRVRLVTPPPGIRTFKIKDLVPYVRQHRGTLLSAAACMVQIWIDKGAPLCTDVQVPGYEKWSTIVGGILQACGVGNWMTSFWSNVKALSVHSEWEPFCEAWWQKHAGKPAPLAALFGLAQTTGLLSTIMGDGNDRAQALQFGIALRKQHQAYHGNYQILSVPQSNSAPMYQLERQAAVIEMVAKRSNVK